MKGSTSMMRGIVLSSAAATALLVAYCIVFGQAARYAQGEAYLLGLIDAAGYSYIEFGGEGKKRWRIEQDGNNLKKIPIILSIEEHDLNLVAVLSEANRIKPAPTLDEKIKELDERLRPVKLVASEDDHLFAELKTPIAEVDLNKLKTLVSFMRKTADEVYPEFKSFIGSNREPKRFVPGPPLPEPVRPPRLLLPPVQVPAVDSKPVPLNSIKPNYTEEARRDNVQGVVIVRVLVDEKGNVESARVVQGLPDGLNEEAIIAARKMKFKPAMKDGKPVRYPMIIRVGFYLR
jgi:TonB family protein